MKRFTRFLVAVLLIGFGISCSGSVQNRPPVRSETRLPESITITRPLKKGEAKVKRGKVVAARVTVEDKKNQNGRLVPDEKTEVKFEDGQVLVLERGWGNFQAGRTYEINYIIYGEGPDSINKVQIIKDVTDDLTPNSPKKKSSNKRLDYGSDPGIYG